MPGENNQLSKLLSVDLFEKWLKGKDPESQIFDKCPIYEYLKHKQIFIESVERVAIVYYVNCDFYAYSLPVWARNFINDIDSLVRSKTKMNNIVSWTSITVGEALKTLKDIK